MTHFRPARKTGSQIADVSTRIQLVMYGRRFACADQTQAQAWLAERGLQYDFVDISADSQAAGRLEQWVGSLSVPTLIVARPGEHEPYQPPAPLRPEQRVRGLNRGTLITEPSAEDLEHWLIQHGLL